MIRHWAALLIALLLAIATPASAFTLPDRNGWVTDEAGILDADTANALAMRLADLQRDTGDEVVVVTLHDLQGVPIERWGDALRLTWNIGGNTGQDRGVLLIVAPNERKVRIAVGYSLGNRIPDAVAASIIEDHILPYFRSGDFSRGVRAGIQSIALELDRNAGAISTNVEQTGAPVVMRRPDFWPWLRAELTPSHRTKMIAFWALIALVVLVVMVLNAGNVGTGYRRRRSDRYYDDDYGSSWNHHSSSGSGWGSSSGSSWGGGSSSSGGSSGGGATGSW